MFAFKAHLRKSLHVFLVHWFQNGILAMQTMVGDVVIRGMMRSVRMMLRWT